jgi:hypothetical protein
LWVEESALEEDAPDCGRTRQISVGSGVSLKKLELAPNNKRNPAGISKNIQGIGAFSKNQDNFPGKML